MKFRTLKPTKINMKWLIAIIALLVVGGLVIANANPPAPDIPLYPGSHYIDLPQTWGGAIPDTRIVMQVNESELAVSESYSELLRQHGWGNSQGCNSGMPGTRIWRREGTSLLDMQGWTIHVEFRGVAVNTTDLIVNLWRGSDKKITCGDL
jgi:hypothetical protein